jgi:hypothetical protein
MSNSVKTPRPSSSSFDGSFVAEESSVRTREAPTSSEGQASSRPESIAERNQRIESKIREAEHMLTRLSPTDHRLRLLCSAILRRDEVLIDAILRNQWPQKR